MLKLLLIESFRTHLEKGTIHVPDNDEKDTGEWED